MLITKPESIGEEKKVHEVLKRLEMTWFPIFLTIINQIFKFERVY